MTLALPLEDARRAPLRWRGVARALDRTTRLAARGSLPGSLLLVGEDGLGREAVAVELAAALICRRPDPPHDDCPECDRVRRGTHPDLELVGVEEKASTITIKQVRDVVEALPQHPFEGRGRVVLFASAHTPPLGAEAASALLKGLEEPPPHVTMILLAANPARVLPTIVSRAVQLRVPHPAADEALAHATEILGLDAERVTALAEAAGGRFPVALLQRGADTTAGLADLVAALEEALDGNAPALVRAATLIAAADGGVETAVAALIGSAAARAEDGERRLVAAEALFRAGRRCRALNLDPASAFAGALASVLAGEPAARA